MLDFLFSPAYAQAAAPAAANPLLQFAPLVVLVVLFYFLLIRPQSKRAKEHRQMLEKLAKGDEIVTGGGLAGKVANLGDAYVAIEIADNVVVKVQRSAITSVLPKGTIKAL